MKIKNYTSSVPAERSIVAIEKSLIEMGARNIAKEYSPEGKVATIAFSIPHGEGNMPFRLPAKKEAIKKLFISKIKRPTRHQIEICDQQAERTAWRNMKEWVELQATMVKLEQVEFMEAFMPYMYSMNKQRTMFELMKDSKFKQLTA